MPELTSLFPDVADALDIESVAIVEKDYFVVDLLRLLKEIKPETHLSCLQEVPHYQKQVSR